MEDYHTIEHGNDADQVRLLWIDTSFSASDMLAIDRASYVEDFEIIGFSDSTGSFSQKAYDLISVWGYVVPVASDQAGFDRVLESDPIDQVLEYASKDAGGLDILCFASPNNIVKTVDRNEEVLDYMDVLSFSLGEVLEEDGTGIKTTWSYENPEAYERILSVGKQRFFLDPRLAGQVDLSEELLEKLEKKVRAMGFESGYYHLLSLLSLYMYMEPQAFIFENRAMHVHTEREEKGWIHFSEGEDIFLATRMNQSQFEKWLAVFL